ncbi:MAG TPA: DUF2293 domain-containing protein [Acidimicrobiia bacterium]|nr:DUF2293 domain-containing protein [Acidimicrobiia bacterium]
MDDRDLSGKQLDVYMTREGPWNPEHGDLEIPEDWDFLRSGDAFVTRRVKAAGTFWEAWRPRGRNRPHRRKLGLWAPKAAIEQAWADAAATEERRAKQRQHGAKSRERQEIVYRDELADAVRQFLAFAPEHSELADEIAFEAATRAAVVGSGRVGRTRTLSLDERAALAARALIRHRCTSYEDDLFDASMETLGMRTSGIERSKLRPNAQSMSFSTSIGTRSRVHPTRTDWAPDLTSYGRSHFTQLQPLGLR